MPVLAVIGSRSWKYQDRIWEYLDKLLEKTPDLGLISGACPHGADFHAESWAKKRGVPILLYPADWSKGKRAGFDRNTKIVKGADVVLAFMEGQSNGTMDSIEKAWKLGKKVLVSTPEQPTVAEVRNFGDLATRVCRHPEESWFDSGDETRCNLCDFLIKRPANTTL